MAGEALAIKAYRTLVQRDDKRCEFCGQVLKVGEVYVLDIETLFTGSKRRFHTNCFKQHNKQYCNADFNRQVGNEN